MRVSVRDLKAHLSQYLSQAGNGELIEITSHRRVVARLSGVARAEHAGVARMLASGAAQWAGGKPAGAAVRLTPRGRSVSDLLLEDRE
jgi:prevent-host-death family protein